MKGLHLLGLNGLLILIFFLSKTEAFAQSPPGVAEFQEVESDIKKFYVALSRLSFVVGAVFDASRTNVRD